MAFDLWVPARCQMTPPWKPELTECWSFIFSRKHAFVRGEGGLFFYLLLILFLFCFVTGSYCVLDAYVAQIVLNRGNLSAPASQVLGL